MQAQRHKNVLQRLRRESRGHVHFGDRLVSSGHLELGQYIDAISASLRFRLGSPNPLPSLQIHYLMCLAANYAHIRDHEKFQELQEMQYLGELDADNLGSKDRF